MTLGEVEDCFVLCNMLRDRPYWAPFSLLRERQASNRWY